jgi:hypothetical protein
MRKQTRAVTRLIIHSSVEECFREGKFLELLQAAGKSFSKTRWEKAKSSSLRTGMLPPGSCLSCHKTSLRSFLSLCVLNPWRSLVGWWGEAANRLRAEIKMLPRAHLLLLGCRFRLISHEMRLILGVIAVSPFFNASLGAESTLNDS